jgi:hypothetical protein
VSAHPGGTRAATAAWWIGCALLALVFALRLAEPIRDGDLFWHLAYARQILESGSPVPDATRYAWMPSSGAMIYCAWLAELALHALWELGGVTAMAALRYVGVALALGLAWHHAARCGLARAPWTPLAMMLAVGVLAQGAFPKPELVSVVGASVMLWLFEGARHAERHGRPAAPWLWAAPVLMLGWVNAHGGFLIVAPLLLATALGDLANAHLAPSLALSARARRTLWAAGLACVLATACTPYGIEYPRQLVADYLLGATPRPDGDPTWNAANSSLLRGPGVHPLLPPGLAMAGALGLLALRRWRRGEPVDAVVLAQFAIALPLYLAILRATFVLAAVFAFGVFTLARAVPREAPASPPAGRGGPASPRGSTAARRAAPAGAIALALVALPVLAAAAIATRTVHEVRCRPAYDSWLGFGPGSINPVDEAEWLASHALDGRLYNIFDSGGYLLWRLHPRYRVMVDSRSFPYLSWFDEQRAFTSGDGTAAFIRRHRADVAVIDLAKAGAWRAFLAERDWRPVFVGPTAAVFARRDDPRAAGIAYRAAASLDDVRNGEVALRAFDFATDAGDWASAERLAARIAGPLACQHDPRVVAAVQAHVEGVRLARAGGRWEEAADALNRGLARKVAGPRDTALLALSDAMTRVGDDPTRTARLREALERVLAPPR